MSRLQQFGIGTQRFVFGDYPDLIQDKLAPDRFDDVAFGTAAISGLDGVFPTMYGSRGRTSSHKVDLKFQYTGNDETNFEDLNSDLHQMKNWGLTYLFKTMSNGTLVFTLGACTRVNVESANDNLSYIWPRGELSFECPKARWYGREGMASLDNGQALDDTLTLITPQINQQTYDADDTISVTNNGDAPAGVYIWIEVPDGETVTNPSLTRYAEDGVSIIDQIVYNAVLSGGDVVVLDARNHQGQLNQTVFAANGYGAVSAARAVWMEIPPGTHEIEVGGTFSDGVIITLEWWDTYY